MTASPAPPPPPTPPLLACLFLFHCGAFYHFEYFSWVVSRVLLSARVTPRISDRGLSFGNPKAPSVPRFPAAEQNSFIEYQTHKNQEREEEEEEDLEEKE